MAIINCPNCKQRVSDKAAMCVHCAFNMVTKLTIDGTSQEQLDSKANLARIKLKYSLQMQAISGVILFLLGIFLWYFVSNKQITKLSHYIELAIASGGAAWYLITRIRLVSFKKQR